RIQSWKLMRPAVVSASKSGAVSPMRSVIVGSPLLQAPPMAATPVVATDSYTLLPSAINPGRPYSVPVPPPRKPGLGSLASSATCGSWPAHHLNRSAASHPPREPGTGRPAAEQVADLGGGRCLRRVRIASATSVGRSTVGGASKRACGICQPTASDTARFAANGLDADA